MDQNYLILDDFWNSAKKERRYCNDGMRLVCGTSCWEEEKRRHKLSLKWLVKFRFDLGYDARSGNFLRVAVMSDMASFLRSLSAIKTWRCITTLSLFLLILVFLIFLYFQNHALNQAHHLRQHSYDVGGGDELGQLPPGWEKATTPTGQIYFMNHITKSTQWEDPRKVEQKQSKVKPTFMIFMINWIANLIISIIGLTKTYQISVIVMGICMKRISVFNLNIYRCQK